MEQKKEAVQTEELKTPTMEKELEEMRREFFHIMEFCIPPKEVREEVMKNLYAIPLSVLKIFKTILDYEIKVLEERIKETERKPAKSKRIKVE
ncbi:hypothetical protein JCM9492_05100 [Aquifex pyrophilus]